MSYEYPDIDVAGSVTGLIKDGIIGQTLNLVSGGRLCVPYYDSEAYDIPAKYYGGIAAKEAATGRPRNEWWYSEGASPRQLPEDSVSSVSSDDELESIVTEHDVLQNEKDRPKDALPEDIIVTWDGPEDLNHPRQWPTLRKMIVCLTMSLVTVSLYMGSAIYTPAEAQMQAHVQTSTVRMSLGLTLFVWGYGFGGLSLAPLSDIPIMGGRNYIYLFCQLLFTVLQIPTWLVNHIAPFAVLRLVAGLAAAPPLSTGAASFSDILEFPNVMYALIVWALAACCAPLIGPLLGGALVQVGEKQLGLPPDDITRWKWTFYFMMALSGGVLIAMVLFFPETSEQALLMRKAKGLRRRLNNPNIVAPGDIRQRNEGWKDILYATFIGPVKMMVTEPVLLLIDFHCALVYFILYLFFEAFPFVYVDTYGFNLVLNGAAFLPMMIGCMITVSIYLAYIKYGVVEPTMKGDPPDIITRPAKIAFVGSLLLAGSMLVFGWTSSAHLHWILPMSATAVWLGGCLLTFQSYFGLISSLYPISQMASAYASNGFSRAILGGAAPLFGTYMFQGTAINGYPVGWGCTILSVAGFILVGLPIYLHERGHAVRDAAFKKYGGSTTDAPAVGGH